MSPLQTGLLVFGGVVLIAVLVYNNWSARRHAPRRADTQSDLEEAVEPSWNDALPTSTEAAMAGRASGADALPVLGQNLSLDPLIDAVAPVALDGHVLTGDALLAALPATRRIGSKSFSVQARREGTGDWEFPLAGQRYNELQVGVQLANRTGAISEIEYSEFVVAARRYADAVGGEAQFPDMAQEVARARELDQFAREHDAMLDFVIRARGVRWSAAYVVQQAQRLGFVAKPTPGKMVLPSDVVQQPPVLELTFDAPATAAQEVSQQAVTAVTLGFEVPQVLPSARPYEQLCELAFALADAMDGQVTDDAGQPLLQDTMDRIGHDLTRLYDALEQHGLPAGAPETRRLFS